MVHWCFPTYIYHTPKFQILSQKKAQWHSHHLQPQKTCQTYKLTNRTFRFLNLACALVSSFSTSSSSSSLLSLSSALHHYHQIQKSQISAYFLLDTHKSDWKVSVFLNSLIAFNFPICFLAAWDIVLLRLVLQVHEEGLWHLHGREIYMGLRIRSLCWVTFLEQLLSL